MTENLIRPFYKRDIQEIDVSSQELQGFEGCNTFPQTTSLVARNCPNLRSFTGCEKLVNLTQINVTGTPIKSLQQLKNTRKLLTLTAPGTMLESLRGIECNYAILELDLSNTLCTDVNELKMVQNFKRLVRLNLAGTPLSSQESFLDQIIPFLPQSLQFLNNSPFTPPAPKQTKKVRVSSKSIIQTHFQTELDQIHQENSKNIVWMAYASKQVSLIHTHSFDTNLQPCFDINLLQQKLEQNRFRISDQYFTISDKSNNMIKLENRQNDLIQIVFIFVYINELFVIAQQTKQRAPEINDFRNRLHQIQANLNQFQFKDAKLEFRRKIDLYQIQVVCFIRPKYKQIGHPLQLLLDLTRIQQKTQRVSFIVGIDGFEEEYMQIEALQTISILNENDKEIEQFMDFKDYCNIYLVVNNEIHIETEDYTKIWELLKEMLEIEGDLDPIQQKQSEIFEEEEESAEYEYQYVYEEETEQEQQPEPEPPVSSKVSQKDNKSSELINKNKSQNFSQQSNTKQSPSKSPLKKQQAYAD
ncbi:Leucine_rich repeats-containing protein [Hexamita inflata]|uniref:Leucine rich repeats-containing protein n=1 Tax=Hexamita inflata TaxID=28002 RepID=A0AA86QUH4_9EUKA|nr:Leucine rich repeats-containing protein [Hexamita inflata]